MSRLVHDIVRRRPGWAAQGWARLIAWGAALAGAMRPVPVRLRPRRRTP